MAKAQDNLGEMYYLAEGIPQDYKQAFFWYSQASSQGNAEAQYYMGQMYEQGHSVAQEYERAIFWCTRSAYRDFTLAQAKLGELYFLGRGVPQDYKRAFVWLSLTAANGGNTEAAKMRAAAAEKLTPEALKEAQLKAATFRKKKDPHPIEQ